MRGEARAREKESNVERENGEEVEEEMKKRG